MKRIFFTAIIPASDIDTKLKKIRRKINISAPIPPLIPLAVYPERVEKKNIDINIDLLEEIETSNINYNNNWVVLEIESLKIPKDFLSNPLPLGLTKPAIIIGREESQRIVVDPGKNTIRNCHLGFYLLTIWDEGNPYNNIELELLWKIKKKKRRGLDH